jgi:nuclear pore complex protein Nup155
MQVASLETLAKLYIARYQYADAAAVYEVLAVRRQGLGDQQVSLAQRLDLYQNAVLQVQMTLALARSTASR